MTSDRIPLLNACRFPASAAFLRPLLLLALAAASALASAEDVILQIAFPDTISITEAWVGRERQQLELLYPGAKVESIIIPSSRFSSDEYSPLLVQRLKELKLDADDRIRLLLIGTHGASGENGDQTILGKIGRVRAEGGDEHFNQTFAALRPWIASDLHLVLDSCSTFCGSDAVTTARAEALLNALNAPNGSLFGATTAVKEPGFRADKKRIGLYSALVFAGAYVNYLFFQHSDPAAFAVMSDLDLALKMGQDLLQYAGVAAAWETVIRPLWVAKSSQARSVNFGQLFELKGGRVEKVTSLSWFFDHEKILGFARSRCSMMLGASK